MLHMMDEATKQDTPDIHMESSCLVILKVRVGAIHVRPYRDSSIGSNHSFRISCYDLKDRSNIENSEMKVFVLDESASNQEKCIFQYQQPMGKAIKQTDLAIFMDSPMDSNRKVSYAVDLGISLHNTSLEDLSTSSCKKIGTAYIYLDPTFSTQGVQRMQIMGTHHGPPIGQMQVEYLVVKEPAAFGVSVPRPKWISQVSQLDAGHRGAGSGCRADLPGTIIENTVASFNYAARHGADMCELDVLMTADGVPVVYHNYSLDKNDPDALQIDQLTLEELRKVRAHTIHDENCKHSANESIEVSLENNKPFPTLEEVLKEVDESCALNIELKWPQLLNNGMSEAQHYREINDFVNRVLNCIYEHSNGRPICLSTMTADIAILLRLKQIQYPVLFLTTGDSQRFNDPTTKSFKNAIQFAQAFDLAGVNPNAAYVTEYLVRCARDRGLLIYAWGKIESAQAIKELKKIGLNGVIYDKIDLIKPQD